MSTNERPTAEFIELLKRSGDSEKSVAMQAQREIAKALETPLRKGVLFGDVVRGIYEAMPLEPGATPEFPLDLLAPGTEIDHVAFTNPGNGRIPERHVEGDYITVNTYGITNSIDFLSRYAREARAIHLKLCHPSHKRTKDPLKKMQVCVLVCVRVRVLPNEGVGMSVSSGHTRFHGSGHYCRID